MNIVPLSCECAACGRPLSLAFLVRHGCIECGRFFCADHITMHIGVACCAGCEPGRRARLASNSIADADERRIVSQLAHDLRATIGPELESVALYEATRLRTFCDSLSEYEQRVVDAVQQRIHDEFIDTTWPVCPDHSNHPLWYAEGYWKCQHSVRSVALLGDLAEA